MPYDTMTPVAALGTVTSAELNKLKNNVDIRTGLYRYRYRTTSNYATSSVAAVEMDATNLKRTIGTIEAQNLLIAFSGWHVPTTISRFYIYVDGVAVCTQLQQVGTSKPVGLTYVIENTTGGEVIAIRFSQDDGNTVTMESSDFMIMGM